MCYKVPMNLTELYSCHLKVFDFSTFSSDRLTDLYIYLYSPS